MELDKVLRELGEPAEPREEPSVLVDPTIQAFCMTRRAPRGSSPPPMGTGRLSRELIELYLRQNAEPDDE
jgi:hypothetical protein